VFARRNCLGQRGVRWFVRQIFFACEEAQEDAPLMRAVAADRSTQHGILGLERVEDGALRDRAVDFEGYFDMSQRS